MILTENSVFVRPERIGFIAAAMLVEDDVNGYHDGLCAGFDVATIAPIAEAGSRAGRSNAVFTVADPERSNGP